MNPVVVAELEEAVRRAETEEKYTKKAWGHGSVDAALASAVSLVAGVLSFAHMALLLQEEDEEDEKRSAVAYAAVHASLLVLFSLCMAWFALWLHRLPLWSRVRAVRRALKAHSSFYAMSEEEEEDSSPELGAKFHTPTRRRGTRAGGASDAPSWINVPDNMLVKGDVVALKSGKRAPARVQRVADGVIVERDDIVASSSSGSSPSSSSSSQETRLLVLLDVDEYVVLESPLVGDVDQFLREADAAQHTELGQQLKQLAVRSRAGALAASIVFAILIGGLAHGFAYEGDWFVVFFIRPIGLLCLLPALTWPLFRFAIEVYWTRRMRGIAGVSGSGGGNEEEDKSTTSVVGLPLLPSTLVHVMGSVTTLCNLDEETLLHGPIVEEVFVLTTKEYRILDCCLEDDTVLRFEDPHWRHYMDVLKPIGLTCSLLGDRPPSIPPNNHHHHHHGYLPLAKYFLAEHDDALRHFGQLARAMGCHVTSPPLGAAATPGFHVHSRLVFVEDDGAPAAPDAAAHQTRCAGGKKKRSFECLLVSQQQQQQTLPSSSVGGSATPPPPPLPPPPVLGSVQMLCFGDSSLLLQFCSEYWNGDAISPLDREFRSQTEAMIKQWDKEDLVSTVFAYRPWMHNCALPVSDSRCRYVVLGGNGGVTSTASPVAAAAGTVSQPTLEEDHVRLVCESLVKGQVFTGMLGSPDLPKPEIASLVETLWTCGIRFVYFSPRDTRKTRKIAEKMGLDTDWNTSISLSSSLDEAAASDAAVAWELKARLPRGLAAIRAHIQSVDDVPLRVSVFTEASPDATAGMVEIMREYGEVCAVYGSPVSGGNVKSFLRANASVAVLSSSSSYSSAKPATAASSSASTDFAQLACPFAIRDDEVPSLLSLLGEGRVALYNYRQANQAFLAVCLVAFALQSVVWCFTRSTEMFTLGHVLWLAWVAIPLASASPALRARSKQEMLRRRMPWKKSAVPNLPNPQRRYLVYALVRLLPCVALVFGVFFWTLNLNNDGGWSWTTAHPKQTVAAQSMALLTFVWCSNVLAGTFASRTKVRVERTFAGIWGAVTLTSLALQLTYNCLFAELHGGGSTVCADAFPVDLAVWLVAVFAPPVVIVLATLPVKRHDATFDLRAMRMLRLDFETKLGQFSPK